MAGNTDAFNDGAQELVTTTLFAAAIPCLTASDIYSAIATVRLRKSLLKIPVITAISAMTG